MQEEKFQGFVRHYLKRLERTFEMYFVQKAPYKFPALVARSISSILPWLLTLMLLILIPILFLGLTLGTSLLWVGSSFESTFQSLYYVTLIILAFEGVIAARAIPQLMRRSLRGWRLLFYAILLHLVNTLVRWIAQPAAVFSLIWSLFLVFVMLFVLFQVKRQYH